VRVALEVIPNSLSTPSSLVTLLERDLETPHAGVCMDFGHAFLGGDVADAIEAAAEHLIATHVHDNHGRSDDHLVPYQGAIDWDAALVTMQKIGYEGTYLLELANTGSTAAVLEEARRARQRFERVLTE
jgi:sugar phosphate isomerase/epimerase